MISNNVCQHTNINSKLITAGASKLINLNLGDVITFNLHQLPLNLLLPILKMKIKSLKQKNLYTHINQKKINI